mmetsp:Transcript_17654/g.44073  ORF Transcript_17654/g.44073 Transcript_17654/m.44073 type:complete len:822 (-) Transcript_17654:75-2540(-)
MKDESNDALDGDEKLIGIRTRRNRRSTSRGETLSLVTSSNDSSKPDSTQSSSGSDGKASTTPPSARNTEEGEKRNHFTRSRNPKQSTPRSTKSEGGGKQTTPSEKRLDDKPNLSINACATILAELDSRSYHQSMIRDANRITERILQPMSLPWTHKVVPVARNIPCDIDEMIDVVTADDGFHAPFDNGNFGFGKFETGGRRGGDSVIRLGNSSENFRAASRRSGDPGIIDFSTIALPSEPSLYNPESLSMVRPPLQIGVDEHPCDDRLNEGETMLRCFEAMQGLKKRKIEQARSCVTSREISIKVNSSSSRSSIFTTNSSDKRKVNSDSTPIVLEAILPVEVENGQRVSKAKAKIVSERLGSYDIRHGLPPFPPGKNTGRIPAGRARLVWTSKGLSDQSYTSLITGQSMDSGAVKRPRNIKVRIKVDGNVCHGPKALDHEETNAMPKSQASLHPYRLIRNLLDGKNDRKPSSPFFTPPIIESVPDSAGCIHVVCTSPGSVQQSSIRPILELAGKNSEPRCTVCWRSTAGGSEVKECTKCGLLAHIDCCLDPGGLRVVSAKEEWTCNVCCYHSENDSHVHEAENLPQQLKVVKKSKRKSRSPNKVWDPNFEPMKDQKADHSTVAKQKEMKCSICRLSGGAMSRICLEGEEHWVHETCRIWTDAQSHSSDFRKPPCVLCGANGDKPIQHPPEKSLSSRCVVKCAAPGCHISVHPMCALASTLASQSMDKEAISVDSYPTLYAVDRDIDAIQKDEKLCSQYTLTFASVRGLAHSFGKDPGARCVTSLPIIFCGIHNPAREQSFRGLCPGVKLMGKEEIFEIPSC